MARSSWPASDRDRADRPEQDDRAGGRQQAESGAAAGGELAVPMIPAHNADERGAAEPGPGVRREEARGIANPGFVHVGQAGALAGEAQVRRDVGVVGGEPAGAFVGEDRLAGLAGAQMGVAEVEEHGRGIAVVLQDGFVARTLSAKRPSAKARLASSNDVSARNAVKRGRARLGARGRARDDFAEEVS